MKVKDLIKDLQKLDPNLTVVGTDGQSMSYQFVNVSEDKTEAGYYQGAFLPRRKPAGSFATST